MYPLLFLLLVYIVPQQCLVSASDAGSSPPRHFMAARESVEKVRDCLKIEVDGVLLHVGRPAASRFPFLSWGKDENVTGGQLVLSFLPPV